MTDAFSTTPAATTPTPAPSAELIGEGKKFKTVDDLAKGKLEADAFIEQLKTENERLRQEVGRVQDVETQLNELRNEIKKVSTKEAGTNQSRDNTNPALSESTIKALIAQTITSTEAEKTTAQNIVEANNQLIRQFGSLEKAQEIVRTKATELAVPVTMLRDVAAKSPSAFLRLVGVEVQQITQGVVSIGSTVNTSAPNFTGGTGQPKEGTKEAFDLKWRDPKTGVYKKGYWDPKVQNEIFKYAKEGTYNTQG